VESTGGRPARRQRSGRRSRGRRPPDAQEAV